jgi:hypothetical protein
MAALVSAPLTQSISDGNSIEFALAIDTDRRPSHNEAKPMKFDGWRRQRTPPAPTGNAVRLGSHAAKRPTQTASKRASDKAGRARVGGKSTKSAASTSVPTDSARWDASALARDDPTRPAANDVAARVRRATNARQTTSRQGRAHGPSDARGARGRRRLHRSRRPDSELFEAELMKTRRAIVRYLQLALERRSRPRHAHGASRCDAATARLRARLAPSNPLTRIHARLQTQRVMQIFCHTPLARAPAEIGRRHTGRQGAGTLEPLASALDRRSFSFSVPWGRILFPTRIIPHQAVLRLPARSLDCC